MLQPSVLMLVLLFAPKAIAPMHMQQVQSPGLATWMDGRPNPSRSPASPQKTKARYWPNGTDCHQTRFPTKPHKNCVIQKSVPRNKCGHGPCTTATSKKPTCHNNANQCRNGEKNCVHFGSRFINTMSILEFARSILKGLGILQQSGPGGQIHPCHHSCFDQCKKTFIACTVQRPA